MPEVIHLHTYNDRYPFGLQKPTPLTFVQLTKHLFPSQFQTYTHNLHLFKSLQSPFIIPLDSYVQQSNTRLLIYYHYEPVSVKTYIQQKLYQCRDDEMGRERVLVEIISAINEAVEEVVRLLAGKKVLAWLGVDNVAIDVVSKRIRFFIHPDFDYVQAENCQSIVQEYYMNERKKLQIQLQEFLQHVLQCVRGKPNQVKKANFIIQGTKLVFINSQQSNRKSCVSKIAPIVDNIMSKQKNATLRSQNSSQDNSKNSIKEHQNSNNSKQRFDIKNILDEKKIHKSHAQTIISNHPNAQKQQTGSKRQVKNYFQNNDDFKKDASFYPEQFIKDESIAEFEGYEDQLERQLDDLKRKKQKEEGKSNVNAQKMTKLQAASEVSTTQSKADCPQPTQLSQANNPNPQSDTSSSADQKQKKKYKVTITTSHEVNVQPGQLVDLKEIQRQLVEDIKQGRLRGDESGNEQQQGKKKEKKEEFNYCNTLGHVIKIRETHNPSSQHEIYTHQVDVQQKNTSLNSIGSNMSSSVDQKLNDDKPFTKSHHLEETNNESRQRSGKDINVDARVHHCGYDIQKILEKIKTSALSQPYPPPPQGSQPQRQSLGSQQLPIYLSTKQITQSSTKSHVQKEYLDKVQKAKLRAEQIMKLAKQRRVH